MAVKSEQAGHADRDGGLRMMAEGVRPYRAVPAPGGANGQAMQGPVGFGHDRMGGPGGNGGVGQGTWLTSQQYKDYLDLLKQRAVAQQTISVPMTPAQYPGASLGGAGAGLSPYNVSQPGYGFMAPRNGGKAAGYGGLPSSRVVAPPRKLP